MVNSTPQTQRLAAEKDVLPLELPGRPRSVMPHDLGAETRG